MIETWKWWNKESNWMKSVDRQWGYKIIDIVPLQTVLIDIATCRGFRGFPCIKNEFTALVHLSASHY